MNRRNFLKTSVLLPIAIHPLFADNKVIQKLVQDNEHEFFDWLKKNHPSIRVLPWYKDVVNKIEDQTTQIESIYKGRQIGMTDFVGYFFNYQKSKNKKCLAICHGGYGHHFVNIERNFASINLHSPAARGSRWDYIYVDEAAYYSENLPVWILDSGAKIILASTDNERWPPTSMNLMSRLDHLARITIISAEQGGLWSKDRLDEFSKYPIVTKSEIYGRRNVVA